MRLINVHTLEFREFLDGRIPRYCILSHRWGDDEVTYKEFRKGLRKDSAGYRKIADFCKFVRHTSILDMGTLKREAFLDPELLDYSTPVLIQIDWIWVDTCCIDKRSSAELSEAINSMFKWYERATHCVAYLADVPDIDPASLIYSSWFRRGWTLQELLAPKQLVVCNEKWQVVGHKCVQYNSIKKKCLLQYPALGSCLLENLSDITTISREFLVETVELNFRHRRPFNAAGTAQKMSWASTRTTSRLEDEAYALLGIFDVNMPLIYGEGRNAFRRLQKEILNTSTDPSIFAFTEYGGDKFSELRTLALRPQSFHEHRSAAPFKSKDNPRIITVGPEGIEMEAATLPIEECLKIGGLKPALAKALVKLPPGGLHLRLCCRYESIAENDEWGRELALLLSKSPTGEYYKLAFSVIKTFELAPRNTIKRQRILIAQRR